MTLAVAASVVHGTRFCRGKEKKKPGGEAHAAQNVLLLLGGEAEAATLPARLHQLWDLGIAQPRSPPVNNPPEHKKDVLWG